MWSKLLDVGVGVIAQEHYDLNYCQYHNWQHIMSCYDYLEANSVPYDIDLDFAVMHHDIIYDNKPDKEARSADFVRQHYPDVTGAVDIIMATADHLIKDRSEAARWMIRADLHQLASPRLAMSNYVKIMNESMQLYGINEFVFAEANLKFMKTLRSAVINNYHVEPGDFWFNIMIGVNLTTQLSAALVGAR